MERDRSMDGVIGITVKTSIKKIRKILVGGRTVHGR
jgi:hypothetical protein